MSKLARRSHPETSKEAAVDAAPRLPALQARAVEAVERWPGRTARELADLLGDRSERTVGRRLGECAKKGLIDRGPSRACTATGRAATTWLPKKEGA